MESEEADEVPDAAAAFPVTIEHKVGETTLDAEPVRVVSIGFAEHDGLRALGVEPVGVRDWYGNQPYGTWPWAQDELGDLTPELLPSPALNLASFMMCQPSRFSPLNMLVKLSSTLSSATATAV